MLPRFYTDDNTARRHLETLLWPDGPTCPHCGNADAARITKLKAKTESTRPGVHKCNECRKPFSVTVGTVFERSHIPLHKWVYASHLLTASKKGISSLQLSRMLGITYKSAWFMAHRIREAMREDNGAAPIGGDGKIVEADETYFGKTEERPTRTTSGRPFTKSGKPGPSGKRAVLSLVERGGKVRSFPVKHATAVNVREIMVRNISRESTLHTDESRLYTVLGGEYAGHETVHHSSKEYVRGDVHTNSVEGYFSIFKRGMKGIYQHCGEAHLHRYLAEFDFRYNHRIALGVNDDARAKAALKGITGKRLTYRRTGEAANA
jgi:transposase-like protein